MPKGVYKRAKRKHAMNREQHQRASRHFKGWKPPKKGMLEWKDTDDFAPVTIEDVPNYALMTYADAEANKAVKALNAMVLELKDRIAMLNTELGIARTDIEELKANNAQKTQVINALTAAVNLALTK